MTEQQPNRSAGTTAVMAVSGFPAKVGQVVDARDLRLELVA